MIEAGQTYVQYGIGMNIAYHNDERGDPTIEYWAFAPQDDEDCECGRFEIRVHEIVPSVNSGTLAVYYRQWFTPDGEPNGKPRRKITALSSLTALIRSRKMTRPLPEGLSLINGQILFECNACEAWTEWPGEPSDFELGHYANVCGGSPRCCP